jgi:hypothetical protein
MITVRQAHERGKTQPPWLDSHHTFSFHRYDDPRYTGFRDLLVTNEVCRTEDGLWHLQAPEYGDHLLHGRRPAGTQRQHGCQLDH